MWNFNPQVPMKCSCSWWIGPQFQHVWTVSPDTAVHSDFGRHLRAPHLTHVTLHPLSGTACNSGLYFCEAWYQSGILKSPCCLQSQSQQPSSKCHQPLTAKQGWIMLITTARCTGKSNLWRQLAMHWEEIPAPSSALGYSRTTILGFSKDTVDLFAISCFFLIRY